MIIEPLLLTTARLSSFDGHHLLSGASSFFFERGEQLFLVTNRHVLMDRSTGHFPNRIEIELHTDAANLTHAAAFSIPLYRNGTSLWRQGKDDGGAIDVALIELERDALPAGVAPRCFTPAHLQQSLQAVEVGTPVLIVGYPLGFHDTLHHLPVVRQAVIASSFGLRFQGQGYFLTDARTHLGSSGAPVVMRSAAPASPDGEAGEGGGEGASPPLPWKLLGVHAARMDMASHDYRFEESLGLNCAWYADILLTLSAPPGTGATGATDAADAPD